MLNSNAAYYLARFRRFANQFDNVQARRALLSYARGCTKAGKLAVSSGYRAKAYLIQGDALWAGKWAANAAHAAGKALTSAQSQGTRTLRDHFHSGASWSWTDGVNLRPVGNYGNR